MKLLKVKLTRPELKKQRDILARYERFLPTLKLKHQLLQQSLLEAERDMKAAEQNFETQKMRVVQTGVLNDMSSGVNLAELSTPVQVVRGEKNVAGVKIPVFKYALFPKPDYSTLFSLPYVDELLARRIAQVNAELLWQAEQERWDALRQEFARVNQRLNLFEKVMIPETRDAIHRIRIYLGDEQTAAVGRAKMARGKQIKKRQKERVTDVSAGIQAQFS